MARRPSRDNSDSAGPGGVWLDSAAPTTTRSAAVAAARKKEFRPAFNGGSRNSEARYCISQPVCRSDQARRSSADDTPSRGDPKDEEHQKQQQKEPCQELGDRDRGAGDRRESQERRYQANDEKHKSHVEHDSNLHAQRCQSRADGDTDEPLSDNQQWTIFSMRRSQRQSRVWWKAGFRLARCSCTAEP